MEVLKEQRLLAEEYINKYIMPDILKELDIKEELTFKLKPINRNQ